MMKKLKYSLNRYNIYNKMSPKKEKNARRRAKAVQKKQKISLVKDRREGLFKVPDWMPPELKKKQKGRK